MENLEWYSENSKNEIYDPSYIYGFKGRKTNLYTYSAKSLIICTFPNVAAELLKDSINIVKNWAERNFNIKESEITGRSFSFTSQNAIAKDFKTKLCELESIEIPFSVFVGNYDFVKDYETLYVRSAKNELFFGFSCNPSSAYSANEKYIEYTGDFTVYDDKSGEPVFVYDVKANFPDFSDKKIPVNKSKLLYSDQAKLCVEYSAYWCVDSDGNPTVIPENASGFKIIEWYHNKPYTIVRPRIPVSDIYLDGDTYYLKPEVCDKYKEIFDNLKAWVEKQKKDIYESIGLESLISKFNDSHKIL